METSDFQKMKKGIRISEVCTCCGGRQNEVNMKCLGATGAPALPRIPRPWAKLLPSSEAQSPSPSSWIAYFPQGS